MPVARRWLANLVWVVVWTVAFFVCLGTLGHTAAYAGIAVVILFSVAVWYATDRRYGPPEE